MDVTYRKKSRYHETSTPSDVVVTTQLEQRKDGAPHEHLMMVLMIIGWVERMG